MTGEQEQGVVDFHRNKDSRQDSRRTSQGDSVSFVVSLLKRSVEQMDTAKKSSPDDYSGLKRMF